MKQRGQYPQTVSAGESAADKVLTARITRCDQPGNSTGIASSQLKQSPFLPFNPDEISTGLPAQIKEEAAEADQGKTIGNYSISKTIGEGTFGKVKLGTHKLTGEKVAIKILEKERITDVSDVERVAREIHILKLIRHPNIIQLYEIIETPKVLFLIMEYAPGGELFDYIVEKQRLKEPEACRFYQQIIAGVQYIHKLDIVHRDLKPENLLLDHDNNIKIVDFGLSNTFEEGETLKTACGSPCYAAPEMIAGKKYVGTGVDTWSCGIILFALVCGYLPFEDPDTTELYKKILIGKYKVPSFISAAAKDLITKVLVSEPHKRYTVQEIQQHPWYQQTFTPVCREKGLIVGYTPMLYEEQVLSVLDEQGFDRGRVVRSLDANMHNHETTSYYLILKKMEREGLIDKKRYFSGENVIRGASQSNTQSQATLHDKKQTGLNSKLSATDEYRDPVKPGSSRQSSTMSQRNQRMQKQYWNKSMSEYIKEQREKSEQLAVRFYLNQNSSCQDRANSAGSDARSPINPSQQAQLYNIQVNSEV